MSIGGELIDSVGDDNPSISFIQCSYGERRGQTLACVKRLAPYIDKIVVVVPEPAEEWPELARYDVLHAQEEWKDDLPAYNNVALSLCEEGDWILITDPDELVCEEFARNMRSIVEKAEQQGVDILCLNAHDSMLKLDGTVDSSISTAYRAMFFKYLPGTKFAGIGETKNLHQTIIFPPGVVSANLPEKYYYEHSKTEIEIWERTFRNVFIGGGGNNVGRLNPLWQPLRAFANENSLKRWPEMRAYLRQGGVHPELRQWIKSCRDRGGFDWDQENFGCWKYYALLHPEELGVSLEEARAAQATSPESGSREEVMRFVEDCFLRVLGRNADTPGKEHYTTLILSGELKREGLEQILKSGLEYIMKMSQVEPSAVLGATPQISKDDLKKSLLKSEWFWGEFKPRKDLGGLVERFIPENQRESFWQTFYLKRPRGAELLELIEEYGR